MLNRKHHLLERNVASGTGNLFLMPCTSSLDVPLEFGESVLRKILNKETIYQT